MNRVMLCVLVVPNRFSPSITSLLSVCPSSSSYFSSLLSQNTGNDSTKLHLPRESLLLSSVSATTTHLSLKLGQFSLSHLISSHLSATTNLSPTNLGRTVTGNDCRAAPPHCGTLVLSWSWRLGGVITRSTIPATHQSNLILNQTPKINRCCCSNRFQYPHLLHGTHLRAFSSRRRPQLADLGFNSPHRRLKFWHQQLQPGGRAKTWTFLCAVQSYRQDPAGNRCEPYRQNVDFPPILPKDKKKPFPVPLKKLQKASRVERKLAEKGIEKILEPPKNGLLVPDLVPVAYKVLEARKVMIEGLAQLLHVIPVHGCRICSEAHVGQSGHRIMGCRGRGSWRQKGGHTWVKGSINDILLPIESYHLFDPFGRRIQHKTRFAYDRIPAVVELCIQAGVDIPEYPSRRRIKPIRMIAKKVIDRGEYIEDPKAYSNGDSYSLLQLDTYTHYIAQFSPPAASDVPKLAQETLKAYETVRWGVRTLMRKYSVKACGYCSEVHVGPWGHNAKLCGEFKHQWRDGQHGWQDATVDEVIPPNYVWHVRDPSGPPLTGALSRYYGKAPAVVEVCVQAGAEIPIAYKPMMRLDIVVPDSEEAYLVA